MKHAIPPFFAPCELVICCRAFALATSLFASRACRQLAITLQSTASVTYRHRKQTAVTNLHFRRSAFTYVSRDSSEIRGLGSSFHSTHIESKLTLGVTPVTTGCPRSLIAALRLARLKLSSQPFVRRNISSTLDASTLSRDRFWIDADYHNAPLRLGRELSERSVYIGSQSCAISRGALQGALRAGIPSENLKAQSSSRGTMRLMMSQRCDIMKTYENRPHN